MSYLKIITHRDLVEEQLLDICKLKSYSWPFDTESQLKWISKNIRSSDLHFLLFVENFLVAYLNLVNIECSINNQITSFLGVGNVCTSEKGKGYGGELIRCANDYISKHGRSGLLFCNETLINFYSKYNWKHIPTENITVRTSGSANFETMCYNVKENINSLIYSDRFF